LNTLFSNNAYFSLLLLMSSPLALRPFPQILEKSSRTVMSKSPNKHNRLYFEARPLESGLPEAIDEGKVGPRDDPKIRSKILSEEFGWDKDVSKKIWCFGPDTNGPNMVVDMCKGVQYLNEIKDSVVAAAQWAMKEGVVCEENMRGVCFEVRPAVLFGSWRGLWPGNRGSVVRGVEN
jgi:elongation factor 2